MDKEAFVEILECALLNFDGVTQNQLVEEYNLDPRLAKIGIQLCGFLKSKNLEVSS